MDIGPSSISKELLHGTVDVKRDEEGLERSGWAISKIGHGCP